MAGTSYQMLGILSFSDRERALPSSTEISELTFVVVKKSTMKLSGVSIFRVQARKLKIKCRPRSPRPRPWILVSLLSGLQRQSLAWSGRLYTTMTKQHSKRRVCMGLTDNWHLPWVSVTTNKGPDCPIFSTKLFLRTFTLITLSHSFRQTMKKKCVYMCTNLSRQTLKGHISLMIYFKTHVCHVHLL